MNRKTERIYVLVGKRVRHAYARFNASKSVAIVDTTSGPVEFRKWHKSEAAAKAAAEKKGAA